MILEVFTALNILIAGAIFKMADEGLDDAVFGCILKKNVRGYLYNRQKQNWELRKTILKPKVASLDVFSVKILKKKLECKFAWCRYKMRTKRRIDRIEVIKPNPVKPFYTVSFVSFVYT